MRWRTALVLVAVWSSVLGGSSKGVIPARGTLATTPGRLTRIVAIAPDDIWAAGWTRPRPHRSRALLLHWDGSTWSEVASPASRSIGVLAASGPKDVWIAGSGTWPSTYVGHFDGSTWHRVPTPAGGDPNDLLAFAPDDVWVAIADDRGSAPYIGRLRHWDGSTWGPAWRIRCPSSGCRVTDVHGFAAGAPTEAWGAGLPGLTVHLGRRGWRRIVAESPPRSTYWSSQTVGLRGVTVAGRGRAWAVGTVYQTRGDHYGYHERQLILTERWNGRRWRIVATPQIVGSLEAVDHGPGATFAVGTGGGGLIMRRVDGRWRVLDLNQRVGPLEDVGVLSAEDAWAVGTWRSAAGPKVPLILHWDGSSWSRVPSP